MKKALLFAAFAFAGHANAALLTSEVTQDLKKICIYSDGSTITVASYAICPMSK